MKKIAKTVIATCACTLVCGCAQVPQGAGENPVDPWEKLNRQTHQFNTTMDDYVMKPVAEGYVKVVPAPVRECVGNVFDNLGEPSNAVNNALPGKVGDSLASVFRFVINTTFGLGGMFDVASKVAGVEEKSEDFGQTLGAWGVPDGPYFVIPFLGPSSVRDTAGRATGYALSPLTYVDDTYVQWGGVATGAVDMRAELLDVTKLLDDAVDPYVMARDGYLANRRNAVYDGNPPLTLIEDEFEDEEEAAK